MKTIILALVVLLAMLATAGVSLEALSTFQLRSSNTLGQPGRDQSLDDPVCSVYTASVHLASHIYSLCLLCCSQGNGATYVNVVGDRSRAYVRQLLRSCSRRNVSPALSAFSAMKLHRLTPKASKFDLLTRLGCVHTQKFSLCWWKSGGCIQVCGNTPVHTCLSFERCVTCSGSEFYSRTSLLYPTGNAAARLYCVPSSFCSHEWFWHLPWRVN